MPKPAFMNVPTPVPFKAPKFSYAEASAGKQEVKVPVDVKKPGDRGNSARPRINNASSFVDGCFCNTRGQ